MNELKHTPGPWEWEGSNDQGWAMKISAPQTDANKHGTGWVCDVHQQFTSPSNGEANARLIAAAPDMLAALLDLVTNDMYVDVHHSLRDKIKAAIDKAIKN